MERLTLNFVGKAQLRTENGVEYLVAPLTLIVPGVLNGSQGPLLYTREEIAKSKDDWNGVPLVVNHPTDSSGANVSASSEGVLDRYGIGFLRNVSIGDRGQLKAESWFDISKTRQVDNRVLTSLQERRPVEVSTGLVAEYETVEEGATYNGEQYKYVAKNYSPDHLAVLPDEIGACSIKDGCGVLMNKETKEQEEKKETSETIVDNELSVDTIRDVLNGQLRERFNAGLGSDTLPESVHMIDMFQNKVIFERKGRYFVLPYKRNKEKVVLSGDLPVEVNKVVRWKPMGSKVLNRGRDTMSLGEEKRVEMVDSLIENSCCYTETDREDLLELSDNLLTNAFKAAEKEVETSLVAKAAKEGFEDSRGMKHKFDFVANKWIEEKPSEEGKEETMTTNEDGKSKEEVSAKPKTEEDWLKDAPQSVQNTFKHAKALEQREKASIIEGLTSELEDTEKARVSEVLNTKSLDELSVLSVLRPKQPEPSQPSQQFYFGAGADTVSVENSEMAEDHLLLPSDRE